MKIAISVLTFLFFLLSWWWYVCPHKQVCPFGTYASLNPAMSEYEAPLTDNKRDTMFSEKVAATDPLLFTWSDTVFLKGDGLPAFLDSISDQLGPNDKLEIIGKYAEQEQNQTAFSSLGLARAHQIRSLFPQLTADRFNVKDELVEDTLASNDPYAAFAIRRIINNRSVREFEGRMIINFPHASNQMLDNEELDEYLQDLVQYLSQTDGKVSLVGHTDSSASTARNERLGHMRADAIERLLVRIGLDPDRIITSSQGELRPIADNTTPQGRRMNRRVELTIIE
ncbi:MAG: OmpA family protein [Saprospiraceae bacterium]|nr:OmpA family protein [Saprospiraceae bacterium]